MQLLYPVRVLGLDLGITSAHGVPAMPLCHVRAYLACTYTHA
jgi:hypothetical protein